MQKCWRSEDNMINQQEMTPENQIEMVSASKEPVKLSPPVNLEGPYRFHQWKYPHQMNYDPPKKIFKK